MVGSFEGLPSCTHQRHARNPASTAQASFRSLLPQFSASRNMQTVIPLAASAAAATILAALTLRCWRMHVVQWQAVLAEAQICCRMDPSFARRSSRLRRRHQLYQPFLCHSPLDLGAPSRRLTLCCSPGARLDFSSHPKIDGLLARWAT